MFSILWILKYLCSNDDFLKIVFKELSNGKEVKRTEPYNSLINSVIIA